MSGCASTTAYFPAETYLDDKGVMRSKAHKAIQLYGDSLGATSFEVTRDRVRYAAAGGIDNSTTTGIIARETGQTVRTGFAWGFGYGMAVKFFQSVLNPIVTKAPVTAAPAAKPAPLPAVGSTIPAQTSATVVPVP